MIVRDATEADIADVVRMAARFFDAGGIGRWVTFDPERMRQTVERLVGDADGVLLVGEDGGTVVGMAAGLCFSAYMSDARLAQELFWWVEPEFRGDGRKLLVRLEDECRARGAVALTMSTLAALNGDRVGAALERAGYAIGETQYIKGL